MQRYGDIINRLSDEQLVRLLTDLHCLSKPEYTALGIPRVCVDRAEENWGDGYPCPNDLARSWDAGLVREAASGVFSGMAGQGVRCVRIPGARITVNPCRPALSEDPYLSGTLSGALAAAADGAGVNAVMEGLEVQPEEASWLDEEPDVRFLHESLIRPYQTALRGGACVGLVTRVGEASETYSVANESLAETVAGGESFGQAVFSIRTHVPAEETVRVLSDGGICADGSATALEAAIQRYRQLSESIRRGHATTDELEKELSAGTAMSDETVREAADRVIGFAFACTQKGMPTHPMATFSAPGGSTELRDRAVRGSAVLLENRKDLLPLRKKRRVGLVGDIRGLGGPDGQELAHVLERRGYTCTGYARGYDMTCDRSEALITEAETLSKTSDVILLFLGTTGRRDEPSALSGRPLSLPSNQLALLDALHRHGTPVVAVVSGRIVDVTFAAYCSGLLLAPLYTAGGTEAVLDILTGVHDPGGRLTSGLYFDADRIFRKGQAYREQFHSRTGPFIGYRYYDTAGLTLGYPFGYGLSYTRFTYSGLHVDGETVIFTVKNRGKRAGTETAQVYIGMKGSRLLRPKKELAAFRRVTLAPGESATVSLPLEHIGVYDAKAGRWVTERGTYTVYVASSVSDVHLTATVTLGNGTPEADGKRLSDYLQSESNILTDQYVLEARSEHMKKSVIYILMGGVILALSVCLWGYCVLTNADSRFLDIVALIMALSAVAFFIADVVNRRAVDRKNREAADRANEALFKDAERVNVSSPEALFVREFDVADRTTAPAARSDEDEAEAERFMFINKEMTFEAACQEFRAYAAGQGILFDDDGVRELISALSSSRLMVTKTDDATFRTLVTLLSSYFGCPLCVDSAAGGGREGDLIFRHTGNGTCVRTGTLCAVESARGMRQTVHISALTDVSVTDLSGFFGPLVRYVRSPGGHIRVNAVNENGAETAIVLPRNLWFCLNLSATQTVDTLPDALVEAAALYTPNFRSGSPDGRGARAGTVTYYQLEYMAEKAKTAFPLGDDTYKRMDRLEAYIRKQVPFAIGNKILTGFELYASVYMACGGDRARAVDSGLSARLLPYALTALSGSDAGEAVSLADELDILFGEAHTAACHVFLRAFHGA